MQMAGEGSAVAAKIGILVEFNYENIEVGSLIFLLQCS